MLKDIFVTFILVFLAELGDKTQLSTILLSGKSNHLWCVFLGSAMALVLSSLIGVFFGSLLNKYVPQYYIEIGASIAFITIGLALLTSEI